MAIFLTILTMLAVVGAGLYLHYLDEKRKPKIGDYRLIRQGDFLVIEAYEQDRYAPRWKAVDKFDVRGKQLNLVTADAMERMLKYSEERKQELEHERYLTTRKTVAYQRVGTKDGITRPYLRALEKLKEKYDV